MEQERIWKKSSYSGTDHGVNCVEVAKASTGTFVRDSKDKNGRELYFNPSAWEIFGAQVKSK